MKILLTNDDGLRTPGIEALYEALIDAHADCGGPIWSRLGYSTGFVTPIAPLTVQSATSHGVTFHEPLMIREEVLGWGRDPRMTGVAVDGRPADCVKLAIANLWPERYGAMDRPDLVISGMNTGANVGINVIYSGTIAAALEAAFLGIPSIAVSLHMGGGRADFRRAAREARRALDIVLRDGLPDKHACLSINVPRTEIGDERAVPEGGYPVRVCRMNTHGLNDKYERRTAPSGEVYYWAAGHGLDFRFTDEASDVELLMKRCTTVTPLRYDLTKKSVLEMWRRRVEGK
ncbi:MAG TPA: 5'/3'-nucleotidase SurE [Phycisphaerales bacterium]|jgi:5'-nucleotidase|nr:5'/3'-nucleotidase SurE [Phycisphaerales bacterium]